MAASPSFLIAVRTTSQGHAVQHGHAALAASIHQPCHGGQQIAINGPPSLVCDLVLLLPEHSELHAT
jgi:hypothetical protein